jgi:hypothetical protein
VIGWSTSIGTAGPTPIDTAATHHLDKIRVDLGGILTHRVHAAVSPAALRDLGLPEFEASTWWNA